MTSDSHLVLQKYQSSLVHQCYPAFVVLSKTTENHEPYLRQLTLDHLEVSVVPTPLPEALVSVPQKSFSKTFANHAFLFQSLFGNHFKNYFKNLESISEHSIENHYQKSPQPWISFVLNPLENHFTNHSTLFQSLLKIIFQNIPFFPQKLS